MKIIQDSIRLGFWPLLVVVLLGLAALTVVYEGTIRSVNSQYVNKLVELDNVYAGLEKYQGELNKTKEELELKEDREDKLTGSYQDLQSELKNLRGEMQQLRQENEELIEKARLVDELNSTVENLQEDVNKWKELYRQELLKQGSPA